MVWTLIHLINMILKLSKCLESVSTVESCFASLLSWTIFVIEKNRWRKSKIEEMSVPLPKCGHIGSPCMMRLERQNYLVCRDWTLFPTRAGHGHLKRCLWSTCLGICGRSADNKSSVFRRFTSGQGHHLLSSRFYFLGFCSRSSGLLRYGSSRCRPNCVPNPRPPWSVPLGRGRPAEGRRGSDPTTVRR